MMGDDIKSVMRKIVIKGERAPWIRTWRFALYSFAFTLNAHSCYFRVSVKECGKGKAVHQTNAE